MRYLLSTLTFAAVMTFATGVQSATHVTRTYVKAPYTYTCIMPGKTETCGNWNVYTPLKVK